MAKINGNLDVAGTTKIKIKELTGYSFDSADYGLLFLDGNTLKLNDGNKTVTLSTTDFKNKLLSSSGNWLLNDFSFNALAFNSLQNVSGLTASSSLLNAIQQLDSAIPKTYTQTYSTNVTHTVTHNLNTTIAHITVIDTSTNQKIKDSEMTVEFSSANSITITLSQSKPIKVLVSTA